MFFFSFLCLPLKWCDFDVCFTTNLLLTIVIHSLATTNSYPNDVMNCVIKSILSNKCDTMNPSQSYSLYIVLMLLFCLFVCCWEFTLNASGKLTNIWNLIQSDYDLVMSCHFIRLPGRLSHDALLILSVNGGDLQIRTYAIHVCAHFSQELRGENSVELNW